MNVFVTGASGGMGSALIPKLVSAGYTVTGLARSSASADKVTSLGATPVQGDLTDLSVLASAASKADIVVHLGFDHGQAFSGDFVGACKKDKAVIEALGTAMTESSSPDKEKTFAFASGLLGITGDDEQSEMHRSPHMPRYESTDAAFSFIPKGLRVIQLRLAPITYNAEKPHDFISMWVGESRKAGYVPYTDEGAWAACSYDAAADLILASLEKKEELPNPVNLHIAAEAGVPFKDCAEVLGEKLGKPAKRVEMADLQQLGFLGNLMGLAKPVKSDYTRKVTGWQPEGKGLVAQLKDCNFA